MENNDLRLEYSSVSHFFLFCFILFIYNNDDNIKECLQNKT